MLKVIVMRKNGFYIDSRLETLVLEQAGEIPKDHGLKTPSFQGSNPCSPAQQRLPC